MRNIMKKIGEDLNPTYNKVKNKNGLDGPIWLETDHRYERSNRSVSYEIVVNKCDSDGDSAFLTKLDRINVFCNLKKQCYFVYN
jgi:hypothetical protein